jgi:uncharacterized membrane protein
LVLIFPITATPDETVHLARAYEIAHGRWIAQAGPDGIVGIDMPTSLIDPLAVTPDGRMVRRDPTAKLTPSEAVDAWFAYPLNPEVTTFRPTADTASYFPVSYLPQAVAVALGEVLGLPAGIIYLLARLATLAVRIALGFAAIRLWPVKPWAFAAINLLPVAMAQSISPGADAMTMSLAALATAIVLRVRLHRDGPRLNAWQLAGLGALGCAVGLTKPVMLIFPLLCWLIPARRLRPGWSVGTKVLLTAVPVVVGAVWVLAGQGLAAGQGAGTGNDTAGQASYLLHHPWAAMTVIVRTFFTGASDLSVRSLAGMFGWLDVGFPLWLMVGVYVALAGYLWCYHRPVRGLDRTLRVVSGVAAVALAYGTYMALYVAWSRVGARSVDGVQGRYLIPALYLALPVFPNLAKLRARPYAVLVKAVPVVLLGVAVIYLAERYYISPLNELADLG